MFYENFKLKYKNKVSELKEKFINKKIDLNDIPKYVMVELFTLAIYKIDYLENVSGNNFDERDFKDFLCDKNFIVEDLFKELEALVDKSLKGKK